MTLRGNGAKGEAYSMRRSGLGCWSRHGKTPAEAAMGLNLSKLELSDVTN